VPIKQGERVLAVLNLESDRPAALGAEEVQLAESLAEAIALALENARLYEATQVELVERRRVEQELQAQRDFALQVMNTMGQGLTFTNAEGCFEFANPAYAQLLGISPDEMIGKKLRDFTLPEDHPILAQACANRAEGKTTSYEVRQRRSDGSLVSVMITGVPRWREGCVAGTIAVVTDLTERKRAGERLRLQSAALEAAANGIVITDREGTILWTNPAFTALTGYTKEEAIGQNPRIVKSGLHDLAFYQNLWQTILSGRVWHNEIINRRKDGDLYVEEMTLTPVRSTGDEITHFIAIKQDVTERRRTENKLRETKDQLEAILRGVADGINVLDAASQLVYVNEAAARAAGYPSAQAMLQDYSPGRLIKRFDLLDESGRPFPLDQLPNRLALQGKQARATTLCYRNKSTDEERWSVVQATPICDEQDQVQFVVSITHDITERKRAEQALRESEAQFRSVVEQSGDGIVLADEQGTVIEWNRCQEQITGLRRAETLDRPIWDILYQTLPGEQRSPVVYQEYKASTLEFLRTGQASWLNQMTERGVERPDGTCRTVQGIMFPIKTSKGFMSASISRDITEHKRAEEALHQYAAKLEARNEELDAFAHTVAHDLKDPLANILGFGKVLEQEWAHLSTDELETSIRNIRQSASRMDNIIDELLLLAGVRKTEAEIGPLDMAGVVTEAQRRLADMIRKHQADIILPEQWPVALGHAPWIEQVWVNYLSNAIKYGGQPPRAELGAEAQPDGTIRFWVRDNGPGLTPEDQARLFTPFTRLDQVRAKGHGLGLSIVRRIMEKLGGQVGVESHVGQGSTFSFTLPAA
jgi:PAS domain S-box-containing protein